MDDLDDLQRVSNVGLNDFLSVVEDVFRVSRRPLSEEPSSPNTSARHFRRGRSEHFSRGALELNKDNSIKLEFLPKGKRKRQKIPWEGNILPWKTLKQCSRSGFSVTPPLHHTIHNSPAAFSSVTPCTASPRAASSREPLRAHARPLSCVGSEFPPPRKPQHLVTTLMLFEECSLRQLPS